MHPDLAALAEHTRESIDLQIGSAIKSYSEPGRLQEAMLYSAVGGGKRVRPLLVRAAANALGTDDPVLIKIGCAVELIHTYSLIHDDLPCMDDDDLRRGRPTLHIAFDEATAVLAGDALQSIAFELLANCGLPDHLALSALRILARGSGSLGMVQGQMLDIEQVGRKPALAELQAMHRCKTGALIRSSVLLGACAAGQVTGPAVTALQTYAEAIGLAFQVRDDILDCISSAEQMGKNSGADALLNKPNYVSLLGLEGAEKELAQSHQTALAAVAMFGSEARILRSLADFIVQRMH